MAVISRTGLHDSRRSIAEKVRSLRTSRSWSQAELADRLGLSQSRLSEIERGDGSFTAEQFLEILRIFNVDASFFGPALPRESEAQNALARLGARHMYEHEDVLPSARMREAADVVREVLLEAHLPRHVAALAPVLVKNVDAVNLHRLQLDLASVGLERRLPWLVENTLHAINSLSGGALPRGARPDVRRAEVILHTFLGANKPKRRQAPKDILDTGIRSLRTLKEVEEQSSDISRRWGVVTALQPEDFANALRESYAFD